MAEERSRLNLRPSRLKRFIKSEFAFNPNWRFIRDMALLIWHYKGYSLAIFLATIFQELAAIWPVNLLGQLIDRLGNGDANLGGTFWLFLTASLLYPLLVRANVILRHKMFYETDFEKTVELVLRVSDRGNSSDPEVAGVVYTRAVNAVSGVTNATYHVLGSFTPVIIKIFIVSGSLLHYNTTIGEVYIASLAIPTLMTILFNSRLRSLRDSHYTVASDASGAGIKTISDKENLQARARFQEIMLARKGVLISLVNKGQYYLYVREAALVGSQFLVLFLALTLRDQINLTPGDLTRIVGYTTQVAAAFIGAVSCLDAVISYTRAYHIYVRGQGNQPWE